MAPASDSAAAAASAGRSPRPCTTSEGERASMIIRSGGGELLASFGLPAAVAL